jgi:glycogen phosphorylase
VPSIVPCTSAAQRAGARRCLDVTGIPADRDIGAASGDLVQFEELVALTENLRWTWHMDVRTLFQGLFPNVSAGALEWPLRLLHEAGPARIAERLQASPELAALARAVVDDRTDYLDDAPWTWYPTTHGGAAALHVAYLSAEFALTDSIPIFAGGLGAVAGEQLKSSSALGIPLVGVGLLYKESSRQYIDEAGVQREEWVRLELGHLPLSLVRGSDGEPTTVTVPIGAHDVVVQIWMASVGRTSLYLLDTDVASNEPTDRTITARLYGGGLATRIRQELVLGVGGVRALERLGRSPNVLHMNEGHSAFATLQQVATVMRVCDVDFETARVMAAAQLVFTTHTPVNAGHDYFPRTLAAPLLAPYAAILGIELEDLLALGRYRPEDPTDSFCPTVLALRLSDSRNGVSRLHGAVTRLQWSGLWPEIPVDEVPIGHVTNGVHVQSWIAPEIDRIFDDQLGADWRKVPGDPESWAGLLGADDVALWHAANAARARLVTATRERRRAADRSGARGADDVLDPDALTIGFVGRFVAYKRPTLFLRDPDRLARLLTDERRPVQFVFAGKAHPDDEAGKQLLRTVTDVAQQRGLERRLVFLEDFDLTADRVLAQGVDLWLNTPRRPLEACGIGGMKAGANGALNLSTLDGWWDEVWVEVDPLASPIGWCIGTTDVFEDHDLQDALDAESLYEQLEREIVPCFYERDDDGIPRRWLASVRQSMASLSETWLSHRMVQQYVDDLYLPSAARAARLRDNSATRGRRLAASLARARRAWDSVGIEVADPVFTDQQVLFELSASLGPLRPTDVTVDLWVMPAAAAPYPVAARLVDDGRDDGRYSYRATLRGGAASDAMIAARVLPRIEDAPGRFLPRLIAWSS